MCSTGSPAPNVTLLSIPDVGMAAVDEVENDDRGTPNNATKAEENKRESIVIESTN